MDPSSGSGRRRQATSRAREAGATSRAREAGATSRARGSRAPRELVVPTRASLHEAALGYLARAAASADSVKKNLERRVRVWAMRASRCSEGVDVEAIEAKVAELREHIPAILERLRELGLVNDVTFAADRATRMTAAGRSRRAVSAKLTQKGIDAETVREALQHAGTDELTSAVTFAKKRKIGPFAVRDTACDAAESPRRFRFPVDRKALATMARAGFGFRECDRVLKMTREEAEELLLSQSAK